ncbi:hypothetical protein TNCV_2260371 [Trichonephila clavipes]|nr:hypothetical protein TNCV_2260371 [Trichonephila clavipes]
MYVLFQCYDPWLYPLLEPCETQCFSKIMHDRMLPVLYGPSLIRKCSAVALACTFTKSLANRKCGIHGCRVICSSPYFTSGCHIPVTTVDELWHCIEAAWASVPAHVIQSLFDYILRRVSAVITTRGVCSGY